MSRNTEAPADTSYATDEDAADPITYQDGEAANSLPVGYEAGGTDYINGDDLNVVVLPNDPDALNDMLAQSLRNEAKAMKAYAKWKSAQGSKGQELLKECTEHRQRTSRLYRVLTGGIYGSSSE